jgi:probable F420-dependent oxidoreductase
MGHAIGLRHERCMSRAPAMVKVGLQLRPQATTIEALRAAWVGADQAGADSVWVWDHFFPLYGDPGGAHFEAYSLLAAMAVDTSRAQLGALVTCNSYRNPNLLADLSRTIDHLSGGRFVLGLGAGWFERDFVEYGYDFGTPRTRLDDLAVALPIIKERLAKLVPPPAGRLPILVGGGGERVTLRLVAEYADAWNGFGPADTYSVKNKVLDGWCEAVGRDPATIERTVAIRPDEVEAAESFVLAGATHLILMVDHPFELDGFHRLRVKTRG